MDGGNRGTTSPNEQTLKKQTVCSLNINGQKYTCKKAGVSYKEKSYLPNNMLIIPMAHDPLLMSFSADSIKIASTVQGA